MTDDDDPTPAERASPPCFMHKVDPTYVTLAAPANVWPDVVQWRTSERERLIIDKVGGVFLEFFRMRIDQMKEIVGF